MTHCHLQIFKLSQGEYIVPQRIEGAYKQSPLLAQIFVHGSPTESYLVAVAVPEEPVFVKAAHEAGFEGNFVELINQEHVCLWLLSQLDTQAEEGGLKVRAFLSKCAGQMCLLRTTI